MNQFVPVSQEMMNQFHNYLYSGKFSALQLEELSIGIRNKLSIENIRKIANPEYSPEQMKILRNCLEQGTSIDAICNIKTGFTTEQMEILCEGIKAGFDISIYANPEYDSLQMKEILKGLQAHLNVEYYANPQIPYTSMAVAREFLHKCTIEQEEYENIKAPEERIPFS